MLFRSLTSRAARCFPVTDDPGLPLPSSSAAGSRTHGDELLPEQRVPDLLLVLRLAMDGLWPERADPGASSASSLRPAPPAAPTMASPGRTSSRHRP